MNTPVAIFERMQENKTVGNCSSMNNRRYFSLFHSLMRFDQSMHQRYQVIRLGTDKMNDFLLKCNLFGSGTPYLTLTESIPMISPAWTRTALHLPFGCFKKLPDQATSGKTIPGSRSSETAIIKPAVLWICGGFCNWQVLLLPGWGWFFLIRRRFLARS